MQATEEGPRLPIPIPPNVMRSLGATVPARRPRTELGTIIGAAAAERKVLRFIRTAVYQILRVLNTVIAIMDAQKPADATELLTFPGGWPVACPSLRAPRSAGGFSRATARAPK